MSHSTWPRLPQTQRASWVAKGGLWGLAKAWVKAWALGHWEGALSGAGWPVGSWQVPGGNQRGERSVGRRRDGLVG